MEESDQEGSNCRECGRILPIFAYLYESARDNVRRVDGSRAAE